MVNFFAVFTHNFDVKWPDFMFIENGNGKAANFTISVRTQAWSPPKAIIHSGVIFLNSLHFFSACSFLVLQWKPLLVGLCVVLLGYCSVSSQSFVIRHLAIATVRNSEKQFRYIFYWCFITFFCRMSRSFLFKGCVSTRLLVAIAW